MKSIRLVCAAWMMTAVTVIGPVAAEAQTSAAKLRAKGLVSDFAGVMKPEAIRSLEAVLVGLQGATGAQVAVVTVPSVPDGDVKTFAIELFEQWDIGRQGKDNGVLIIASIQDRRVEIEVGYGLEGILPDAKTGRILDQHVIPAFKQNEYGAGLASGALAIAHIIADDAGVTLSATRPAQRAGYRRSRRASPLSSALYFLFMLLMIPVFIRNPWLLLLFMGGRGGGFGGGFGGGGFGGFGGGMSGGGGAGRGW